MGLIAVLVFGVAMIWICTAVRRRTMPWRDIPRLAAAFVAPWLAVVLLLAAYNAHRFQSCTEFGVR
jgi:multisubunit Na+/H+ antiporter MnhB subunit